MDENPNWPQVIHSLGKGIIWVLTLFILSQCMMQMSKNGHAPYIHIERAG